MPKFNYFSHLSGYWEKIKTNKDINISKIEDIEKFLVNLEISKSDWSSLLTHHDLETNILESSNGYKIIDWEYASNNGFHDFDRCSIGLMNDNKMLNDFIKFMNDFLVIEIN